MSNPNQKGPSKLSRRQFLRDSLLMGGAAMFGSQMSNPFLRIPYTINPQLAARQEPIELQFWHQWGGPPNSTALEEIGANFNKLYPNITVKLTNIDDQSKIAAAIGAGTPPDVVHFVLSDAVPEYAHRGALQDLTPLLDKDIPDWKERLYWYGPEVGSYNGKLYALASANFNVSLLYNKALFEAAGLDPAKPPMTLEELVTYAEKMTVVDKDGNIQQVGFIPDYPGISNGQACNLIMYGWAFGGKWFDPETNKITADDPANIEALKWETSFYEKLGPQKLVNFAKSAGAYLTEQDLFRSGKLAMVYDGIWNIVFPSNDLPFNKDNIVAAYFPAPEKNPDMYGVSYADSDPNCLPAGAPHPQEAWEFLKFMCFDPATAAKFAQVVANPCQLLEHPPYPLEQDARFAVSVKQQELQSQRVFPRIAVSHTYAVKLGEAEQAVLLGQMSAEDALKGVTAEVQSLLEAAGPAV